MSVNNFTISGTLDERATLRHGQKTAMAELLLSVDKRNAAPERVPVLAFGALAEKAAAIPAGSEVLIAGRVGGNAYVDKAGRTWNRPQLIANKIVVDAAVAVPLAAAVPDFGDSDAPF